MAPVRGRPDAPRGRAGREKAESGFGGLLEGLGGKAGELLSAVIESEAIALKSLVKGVMAPWAKLFAVGGLPKMQALAEARQACTIPAVVHGKAHRCDQTAALQCSICGRLTCVGHSLFDHAANAICHRCMSITAQLAAQERAAAQAQGAGSPFGQAWAPPGGGPSQGQGQGHAGPTPADREARRKADMLSALRALGLDESASWGHVKRAHTQMAADAQRRMNAAPAGSAERAAAEDAFKKVNMAYTFLRENKYDGGGE